MHEARNLDEPDSRPGRPRRPAAPIAGRTPEGHEDGRLEITSLAWLRADPDGRVVAANGALVEWLGQPARSAVLGHPLARVLQDESLVSRWLQRTAPAVDEIDLRRADGRVVSVRAETRPDGQGGFEVFMVRSIDSELIARVARLEAALTLTAGTVHDVNNVLTVLAGNLFLLTENVRDNKKLYDQARRARNAAERGSTLLRELLTFDRETDNDTKAICPANHVLALQPLLSRAIGADHELKVSVDRQSGSTLASAAQLESALINLVVNARDALPQHGEVQIDVGDATIDEDCQATIPLPPGDYVCVKVVDNGSGIPESILPRVTQPMFSTKAPDRGSGLGLAMVSRFVEQAGGALQIESGEGAGTCVTVWLPRRGELAETTANMTLPLSTLPGGDERVLLVSRDRDMRTVMQQILETLGYAVVSADSPENVEEVLAGEPRPALVISERRGGGRRCEQRWLDSLRESSPLLKHIALLEAGSDPRSEAADADGHVYRPVQVLELAHAVRGVLEEN